MKILLHSSLEPAPYHTTQPDDNEDSPLSASLRDSEHDNQEEDEEEEDFYHQTKPKILGEKTKNLISPR